MAGAQEAEKRQHGPDRSREAAKGLSGDGGFRNIAANAKNSELEAVPGPFANGFKNTLERQRNAMLFTLSQAAKEAGVSKSTLSKALARGRMTAVRREDGSFQIEASELFRVFPRKPEEQEATGEQEEQQERVEQPRGTEAAILRERLNAAQDSLRREREERERERTTWERERETILERERIAAEDLRRRLDKAEEHILALRAPEAPEKPQEPDRSREVVEDMQKRLEDAEARIAALGASEKAVERLGVVAGAETSARGRTGFLGRFLRRQKGALP